jgi:hypothetical protein
VVVAGVALHEGLTALLRTAAQADATSPTRSRSARAGAWPSDLHSARHTSRSTLCMGITSSSRVLPDLSGQP